MSERRKERQRRSVPDDDMKPEVSCHPDEERERGRRKRKRGKDGSSGDESQEIADRDRRTKYKRDTDEVKRRRNETRKNRTVGDEQRDEEYDYVYESEVGHHWKRSRREDCTERVEDERERTRHRRRNESGDGDGSESPNGKRRRSSSNRHSCDSTAQDRHRALRSREDDGMTSPESRSSRRKRDDDKCISDGSSKRKVHGDELEPMDYAETSGLIVHDDDPGKPVFETDSSSVVSHHRPSHGVPHIARPMGRSGSEFVPYRKSSGVSIDNYDPAARRPFTDPLTVQALANLGLDPEELFYPNAAEIIRFTRDKDMIEITRQKLCERVSRTQECVRVERDRLAAKPPPVVMSVRDEKLDQTKNRTLEFAALERKRMLRIQEKNRKEAEDVILAILIEQEIMVETAEQTQREKEAHAKHEQDVRVKRHEERRRHLERVKELEAQEAAIAQENERKKQESLEQMRRFEERKAEADRKRQEYFETLEAERSRKNAEAKRLAAEFEEKRRRDFDEQRRVQTERDREWREKEEKKQEERREHTRLEELRKSERTAVVRANQKDALEVKRIRTNTKQQRQQQIYDQLRQTRQEELDAQCVAAEERQRQSREYRLQKYQEHEAMVKERYESHEKRSRDYYRRLQEEGDQTRRQGAIERAIKNEEAMRASRRIAKRKETDIAEEAQIYDARLHMLNVKEQMRKQQFVEAQNQRNRLEREKSDLVDGLVNLSDVRKKGTSELHMLADKLGIDMGTLRVKAAETRRGKGAKNSGSMPVFRPGTPNSRRSQMS